MVGAQDWGQCFTFEGQTYSLGKAFTTAGFSLADEHTAGFEVMQYCALTFVSFLDPTQRIDSLTKQTTVKAYQATLQQHNIQLTTTTRILSSLIYAAKETIASQRNTMEKGI